MQTKVCGNILPLHQQGLALDRWIRHLTESCLRHLESSYSSHEARDGKSVPSCSGASMEPVVFQVPKSLSTEQPSLPADLQVIVRTITGSLCVLDVQPHFSIGDLKLNI